MSVRRIRSLIEWYPIQVDEARFVGSKLYIRLSLCPARLKKMPAAALEWPQTEHDTRDRPEGADHRSRNVRRVHYIAERFWICVSWRQMTERDA